MTANEFLYYDFNRGLCKITQEPCSDCDCRICSFPITFAKEARRVLGYDDEPEVGSKRNVEYVYVESSAYVDKSDYHSPMNDSYLSTGSTQYNQARSNTNSFKDKNSSQHSVKKKERIIDKEERFRLDHGENREQMFVYVIDNLESLEDAKNKLLVPESSEGPIDAKPVEKKKKGFFRRKSNDDSSSVSITPRIFAPKIDSVEAYIRITAEQGNAYNQFRLGLMYDFGYQSVEQSVIDAVEWYSKAADNGISMAMEVLADMYRDSRGVQKSDEKALELYKKASNFGYSIDKYIYASNLESGLCGSGLNDAIYYYKVAAQQGYPKAIDRLKELKIKF